MPEFARAFNDYFMGGMMAENSNPENFEQVKSADIVVVDQIDHNGHEDVANGWKRLASWKRLGDCGLML